MNSLIFLYLLCAVQPNSFKQIQLTHSRVAGAYADKETIINQYFKDKNILQSGFNLYIRAFKKERKLEVWVKEKGKDQYVFLTAYEFCSTSGRLGPKRKEGDLQIPEGVYHIGHFNPVSNFFLSLGINYPNASDKILGHPKHPGGSIYIHGNCVTIGCIPITDDKIKELYVLAVEARNNGQQRIPVHIFPFDKMEESSIQKLSSEYDREHLRFGGNLAGVYRDFEKRKKVPRIVVEKSGEYSVFNELE